MADTAQIEGVSIKHPVGDEAIDQRVQGTRCARGRNTRRELPRLGRQAQQAVDAPQRLIAHPQVAFADAVEVADVLDLLTF